MRLGKRLLYIVLTFIPSIANAYNSQIVLDASAPIPDCKDNCGLPECLCPNGHSCTTNEECLTKNCLENTCLPLDAKPNVGIASSGGTGYSTTIKRPGSSCSANDRCGGALICAWNQCMYYWHNLDFYDGIEVPGKFSSKWNVQKQLYGEPNRATVMDPKGSQSVALRVRYPAGSRNPGQKSNVGGTGVVCDPLNLDLGRNTVLEYQVYFPPGFNFVLGGKLPGMYGGRTGCTGGDPAKDCFSTRLMWRKKGDGEVYMYLDKTAQHSSFCLRENSCRANSKYGYSLGRGLYNFAPGHWTTIKQIIRLNTFKPNGQYNQDGVMLLYVNGKLAVESHVVVYRTVESVKTKGIEFQTFFGGSSDKYASPTTQYSYFKRFRLGIY